jgi:hypothetical protein
MSTPALMIEAPSCQRPRSPETFRLVTSCPPASGMVPLSSNSPPKMSSVPTFSSVKAGLVADSVVVCCTLRVTL